MMDGASLPDRTTRGSKPSIPAAESNPYTSTLPPPYAAEYETTHSEVTSRDKVINTLKLFEQILLLADLTCAELARSGRVRRQFHASIDSSSVLQSNLCLEPRVKGSIWANKGKTLVTGPLARFHLADLPAKEVIVRELHPALEVARHFQYDGLGRFILGNDLRGSRGTQVRFINKNCITQVPHDSALLYMLLSQSPTKKIYVKIKGLRCTITHGLTHGFELEKDAGITFGLLLKAVRTYLNNYKGSEASLDYVILGSGEPFTTKQKLALEISSVSKTLDLRQTLMDTVVEDCHRMPKSGVDWGVPGM
jgi:hypothetical protein